ncbi:NAD(P)H-dependent glycerol-3-phosphate dehydrogenase [Sphingomonas sp.]|uniref:NAD(P)H-dependent glycerol-3-phosphate dehydrogenase n=1 Tax=Sphingomonas sp. TaxID=28214 RepID=UPI001D3C3918|nr:NAD(P)H-dependent glycerol-3-phosphate dehydrogenase [Sphingomonas sp.]MBX9796763.1 NAD(P)-dependent glycerol-3-phosphate dehydrogenase [Sphingomonas sp.]
MTIGVIGAGAWGTALAQVLAAAGAGVTLWAREAEVVERINQARENPLFLPGVTLSPAIRATGTLAALAGADALLVVCPAQHVRAVLGALPPLDCPLILCAKGIEAGTLLLMSEVAGALHPAAPLAVLSGPTFAHEVAAGKPTALTLACADAPTRAALIARFAGTPLRPYGSADVVGAEIGGAVKNVLAIACGVVSGAGLGENARAATIARGFAEMTRFGVARGGQAATLAGLSGLGDLVLTCSSTASRNFALGMGLGQGRPAAALLADRRTVAEGAHTAPVLQAAAAQVGVEMPMVQAVCALLDGAPVAGVVDALLSRPLKDEGV